MTTTITPTAALAEKLTAVAEHLRKNPNLSTVNVDERSVRADFTLQISAYQHLGEIGGVQALLAWAKSFDNPVITVQWHDEKKRKVSVNVDSTLGGYSVRVWDTEGGDLYRWMTGGKYDKTPITLEQLTLYVAAGTVEGLGAR